MDNFGNRLKRLRLKKGLTQEEVANLIGVSSSTYRDWEYGKKIRGEPYVEIAKVLDVSVSELITGAVTSESDLLNLVLEAEQLVKRMKVAVKAV